MAAVKKDENLQRYGHAGCTVQLEASYTYGWARSLCVRRLTASLRAMAAR